MLVLTPVGLGSQQAKIAHMLKYSLIFTNYNNQGLVGVLSLFKR
jgi:hypothetical protein